jgi:hypothetical protein
MTSISRQERDTLSRCIREPYTNNGLPLSSFGDLIAHLATQTMNVVAVFGTTEAALTTVTKATAAQEAAFEFLKIETLRAQ